MPEHLSPATQQLHDALGPEGTDFPHAPFRALCLAEATADDISLVTMGMPGNLRNDSWTRDDRRVLIETYGFTPEQASQQFDIHMARKEVLRERLAAGARIRSLIAVTAFKVCRYPEAQAAHMREMMDRGSEIGVAPRLSRRTFERGVTNSIIYNNRHIYTLFNERKGEHEAWYPDAAVLVRRHQPIHEQLWQESVSPEPLLEALEAGEVPTQLIWEIQRSRND